MKEGRITSTTEKAPLVYTFIFPSIKVHLVFLALSFQNSASKAINKRVNHVFFPGVQFNEYLDAVSCY